MWTAIASAVDLLRRSVVPHADHFDDLEGLAGLAEHFAEAFVTIAVDRVAGHAAHFEQLAGVGRDVAEQPVGHHLAHQVLVFVDLQDLVGIEHVVEGHEHDTGLVGAADDGAEGGRIDRDRDDRVVAGIDEVIDRGELRGDVGSGGDDLEFLDERRDLGLSHIGLRRLDHLNAPGVADEAVRQSDTVGPFLLRILEELRIGRPRNEALRLVGRAGYDFRAGGERRLRNAADQRGHGQTFQPLIFHENSSLRREDGPLLRGLAGLETAELSESLRLIC